jgi:hypothetical protein
LLMIAVGMKAMLFLTVLLTNSIGPEKSLIDKIMPRLVVVAFGAEVSYSRP